MKGIQLEKIRGTLGGGHIGICAEIGLEAFVWWHWW